MNVKRIATTVAAAVAAVGIAAGSASASSPTSPPSLDHLGCPSHATRTSGGYTFQYNLNRVGNNTQGEYGVYYIHLTNNNGLSTTIGPYQYWC